MRGRSREKREGRVGAASYAVWLAEAEFAAYVRHVASYHGDNMDDGLSWISNLIGENKLGGGFALR